MYKIKRFNSDENSGISTGAKLAIGGAALGGGLLAGKAGLLGKGVKSLLGGGSKVASSVVNNTPKLLS